MSSRSRRHGEATSRFEALTSRVRGGLPVLAGAVVIIGAGLWFAGLLPSLGGDDRPAAAPAAVSDTASSSSQTMPKFVTAAAPRVREAYEYAAAHGAELAYVPCYCGCGGHSGHRDVRDCFIKRVTASGITYEQHGSTCDVCVSIVLDAKTMLDGGQPLTAVRKSIDAKYSKIGPGTDTPLPPGMEE